MTNPTSNFGWQMPTNTDLVTDLPADFEVFGQAVDTSMADLKGGTTGQILSKTTNADMDFTWIANDQGDITGITASSPLTGGGTSGAITVGIQAASTTQSGAVQLSDSTSTTSSILAATPTAVKAAYDKASTAATTSVAGIVQLSDSTSTTSSVLASTPTATKSAYDLANAAIAKSTVTTAGDIIYRNATVPTRLGIGTAGQVLKVNSGATAPEWGTASTGALTLITTTSFSAAAAMSVNNVFTSTYTNYLIQFKLGVTAGTVDIYYKERSSGTDDSDFYYYGATKVTNSGTVTGSGAANTTAFTICNTSTDGYGSIIVYSPAVATNTYYDWKTMDFSPNIVSGGGLHASTPTTCDGFSIIPASSTITGTVSVYGYSK
jgi:hypothetical protein